MRPSAYRMTIIIASVTFVVGALFVYNEFISVSYEDILVLRAKRDGTEEKLAETQKAIEAIQQLKEKYASLTELKNNLSLMLPEEEHLPLAINQLQTLAAQHNMSVQSLIVEYVHPKKNPLQSASTTRPMHTLRLDMRLIGTYDDMKGFLEAVQNNVRVMDVDNFKINGGGSHSSSQLEHSLVVHTYYQEDDGDNN